MLAGEAITLARREWILEGRHAELVRAAAALLLAARGHGLPFKGKDLAAIGMKANAKAPRERLKEVTTVAVSLARQLPGRESLSDKALEKALHRFIPEINLARTLELEALRDGVDSDDDGDGDGDGEAAPGGGTSLVPAGAVVVRRDDSLLAALGASDPAAFVASAARRAVRERKLAAAQARIAAAGGAASTALVINGVRAEEEEAPLDAEDKRIEAALRQGTPHEAILGGHYEAAASDVGELSEGEEGGGDGAPEEELGDGDLPYRATSGLVRERTARHAEGGSSGLTTYMGDTSLDWGTEGEPPAKAPRWCDRALRDELRGGREGSSRPSAGRALHVLQPLRDQQQVGVLLPPSPAAHAFWFGQPSQPEAARALGGRADALVVGGGGVDGGAGGVGHRSTQIRAKRPEI